MLHFAVLHFAVLHFAVLYFQRSVAAMGLWKLARPTTTTSDRRVCVCVCAALGWVWSGGSFGKDDDKKFDQEQGYLDCAKRGIEISAEMESFQLIANIFRD